ncbi:MAG TPA: hypothetical protein VMO26_30045 [Vicinamibacterales bacterium]|nr:hypothetical protein [Vicinamibacterales bacterium]
MRALAIAATCLTLLAACTADDEQAAAEPDAEAAEQPGMAGVTMADFAGTWQNTARLEGVDEPVTSTMSGSASGDDWTMSLEGRDPIPMQVSVVGDSLIGQSAEYESILRPGVMVSVRTASVLRGDVLMGNLVATYRTPEGEQRVSGSVEGRRMQ